MVKIVRAAAFAAAALACLASCSLGTSIFPNRLMGYEAYADLERFIDPEHVGAYRFQIVRDSTSAAEYLVLASDDGSFGDDCVVVLNADLKVLGHYTLDQLDAMDAANPYSGVGAMVDESGCIVVGNRRFTVESRTIAYLDTPPALYHSGLAVPNAVDRNLANIHGNGQNLEFDRYNASWTFMAPVSLQLSALTWHEVVGVWLTAAQVLLVVRHDPDPDVAHVLAMGDVAFATGVLPTPLIGQPPPFANTIPSQYDVDWDTLGYTEEGFAAFRWTATPEYFRFDQFGVELSASGEIPEGRRPDRQRHCYGRTSGWYVMDLDAMSLERRKWWWK